MLKRFSEFAQSHTGHVTLEEFSALLGLDITDDVAELFALYDRVRVSESVPSQHVHVLLSRVLIV